MPLNFLDYNQNQSKKSYEYVNKNLENDIYELFTQN